MHSFKQFGIKVETKSFTGDKIKIDRILNREIIVHDFKIEPTKFQNAKNAHCLHMQIELNSNKHILFTGSTGLMEAIKQVPKESFPFTTTIAKDSERLMFT